MPEECNNRGMNRRDFLIGATAVATFLIPNTSLPIINSNPSNSEPAKRAVYEKAKKVYDLVREVWYPEREDRIIAAGTRGILNLASTGPDYDGLGYYLFLERDDLGLTKLELTAVGGYIDQKITREIDGYLANLGLIYTPLMQGIDPTPLEQSYPEASAGVTSTIIALHRIWINKILGYARKHGLPVLSLESEDLASLYSIGFAENRGSSNLAGGTQFNLKDTYIPQAILDSIISEKYVPLLTQAVPQLEKEVERINSLRSDKKRVLFEKQHERARLEMMKLKDPSISLVQRILEFPVK